MYPLLFLFWGHEVGAIGTGDSEGECGGLGFVSKGKRIS